MTTSISMDPIKSEGVTSCSTFDLLYSRSAWKQRSNIPEKSISNKIFEHYFIIHHGKFLITSYKFSSERIFAIPFYEFAGNGSLHYALNLGSTIYFETPNAWSKQKYGVELLESIASFLHAFNSKPGGREYLLDNGMLYFLIEDPLIKEKFLNLGFTPVIN